VLHFRVERPDESVRWLLEILNREGQKLDGTRAERQAGDTLLLRWEH
jgi:hypothetical protein